MSTAWTPGPAGDGSVAAIIVTFNRREILRRSIVGLFDQTLPVHDIIVVDNASSDGTPEMLSEEFHEVTALPLPDNAGPGAAFAAGMRHARERGYGWAWLFNDDDVADPEALAVLMGWCDRLASRRPALVGCWNRVGSGRVMYNGSLWRGRHRYRPSAEGADAYPIDVVRFSGTLVCLEVVAEVGLPRSDYFFMMEEVEYCLRMPNAHRTNFVVPMPLVTALYEGSPGGPLLLGGATTRPATTSRWSWSTGPVGQGVVLVPDA